MDTNSTQHESEHDSKVQVKRGKVDSLDVYEVTGDELELIERGSPNSLYLNFSIFLISIGTAFLITLLTVDIVPISKMFIIFTLVTIVAFVVGVFLFILWYRNRSSLSGVFSKIKGRMQPDSIPPELSSETETP